MAKRKTLEMSNNGHATGNGVAVAEKQAEKRNGFDNNGAKC